MSQAPSQAAPVPAATTPSETTPTTQQQAAPASETDAAAAPPEKKEPDESDPWFGHLHHLTTTQEKALDEFRTACAEKGLYKYAVVAGQEGGEKEEGEAVEGPKDASHDDATLLYVSISIPSRGV